MKKILTLLIAIQLIFAPIPSLTEDTWANWERRLNDAFQDIKSRSLGGQPLGILVPSDPRQDILPFHAIGYEILAQRNLQTVVLLMPAPKNYPLSGIVMPETDIFLTSIGYFNVDDFLRASLQNLEMPIYVDNTPFTPVPQNLLNQMAAIKYILKGRSAKIKILPIMVKLTDINSQAKDLGPYISDKIMELGLEHSITFVIMSDISKTSNEEVRIQLDSHLMSAIRNLDIDSMVDLNAESQAPNSGFELVDIDVLGLGSLILRWLRADHGEVLSYMNSGQLVLTKDKRVPTSFVVAGYSSDVAVPPRVPHINREKYVKIFDELFRSDILTLARQTVASILDLTAAKPPSLEQKEAGKKWPIYVSIYDDAGKLVGESGTHKAIGPLEESIQKYSFEAVRNATPPMTKEKLSTYVIEVSIPYGFSRVSSPEQLVPLLNGLIVTANRKSFGFHPNNWRIYPDTHQLLNAICFKLALKPWAYATRNATIESFRILAFNEKEPFQDLGVSNRKKKKKKKDNEDDGGLEGLDDFGGEGDFTF